MISYISEENTTSIFRTFQILFSVVDEIYAAVETHLNDFNFQPTNALT